MYVKVYYNRCPSCGSTWSTRLIEQTSEIRLGKEEFVCECGISYKTGNIEWAHLDEKQRRGYFFSSVEAGIVVICTLVPPLFAYFVADGWRSAFKTAAWGTAIAAVFVLLSWAIKAICVKQSLRRLPHELAYIPGSLPWTW